MIEQVEAAIATDVSGNATVYLGSKLRGKLHAIKYEPGTLATGASLTITGETTGVPILTKTNAGTSNVWFYPGALFSKVADGSAATDFYTPIHIFKERIKVVVASGGNALSGTIKAFIDTDR